MESLFAAGGPATGATTAIGITHLSALALPPVAFVEAAAAAGLQTVCLRVSPAVPGGVAHPLDRPAERRELLGALEATGVRVLGVEQLSLCEELDVAACEPVAQLAAEIGATRIAVAADSADHGLVAEQLAALASLVTPYGLAVDLEFMPFRAVRTLGEAVAVVRRASVPGVHVLVDALHLRRSGGDPTDVAALDPALLGPFHLCDAPAAAPPPEELAAEARTRRLAPGDGGLPLADLVAALPPGTDVVLEVPVDEPEGMVGLAAAARGMLAGVAR